MCSAVERLANSATVLVVHAHFDALVPCKLTNHSGHHTPKNTNIKCVIIRKYSIPRTRLPRKMALVWVSRLIKELLPHSRAPTEPAGVTAWAAITCSHGLKIDSMHSRSSFVITWETNLCGVDNQVVWIWSWWPSAAHASCICVSVAGNMSTH